MTGESKIHENESLPFYAAYRALENRLTNLSYVEFGLFVFDGDIRIFESRPDEEGNLCQLSGSGQLSEVGIADSVSNEATPLESTLTRFRYVKTDVERLTPDYRYIPFDNACEEIAAFAGKSKNEIKQHFINVANRTHICLHHPYCGFAQPEHEYLWLDSAYPEYEIDKILRDEFNISESEIAFDVEAYLCELKANGESAGEIKRIRNILNRRVIRNADLVIRQNALTEMAALRPSSYVEYEVNSSDLIKRLLPLPENPCFEERVKRFVWLNVLSKRKAVVDTSSPNADRSTELVQLNQVISQIQQQLGCIGTEQVDVDEQRSENIEGIIVMPIAELLDLSSYEKVRKRALVAVADSEDEATQLLLKLTRLEDFKRSLENELCRVKDVSYQFEESRKADINRISAKITEFDEWLDNYRTTGKLEGIKQHEEIEIPKSVTEAVGNDGAVSLNKRAKKDPDRDEDYLAFEKDIGRGEIDKMKTPEVIRKLIERSTTLWSTSKYNAWHSNQNVTPNKTPGVRSVLKKN